MIPLDSPTLVVINTSSATFLKDISYINILAQKYIFFSFKMTVCAKILANLHDELVKIVVEEKKMTFVTRPGWQ